MSKKASKSKKKSKSKKRKVIDECRVFNENWKTKYFFTELDGKAICVICQQSCSSKRLSLEATL